MTVSRRDASADPPLDHMKEKGTLTGVAKISPFSTSVNSLAFNTQVRRNGSMSRMG